MRYHNRAPLLLFCLFTTLLVTSSAAIVELAGWNFDASTVAATSGANMAAATCTLTSGSWASLTVVAYNAGVTPGTTTASGQAYSTTTYTQSPHGVIFTLPTTGYTSIMFTFDMYHSATGPNVVNFEYSTTGPAGVFVPSGLTAVSTASSAGWTSSAVIGSLGPLPAACNNIASCSIRLIGSATGTLGATGTLRLDNFVISGNNAGSASVTPTRTRTVTPSATLPAASTTPSATPSAAPPATSATTTPSRRTSRRSA